MILTEAAARTKWKSFVELQVGGGALAFCSANMPRQAYPEIAVWASQVSVDDGQMHQYFAYFMTSSPASLPAQCLCLIGICRLWLLRPSMRPTMQMQACSC
jgi:hypothetical protein